MSIHGFMTKFNKTIQSNRSTQADYGLFIRKSNHHEDNQSAWTSADEGNLGFDNSMHDTRSGEHSRLRKATTKTRNKKTMVSKNKNNSNDFFSRDDGKMYSKNSMDVSERRRLERALLKKERKESVIGILNSASKYRSKDGVQEVDPLLGSPIIMKEDDTTEYRESQSNNGFIDECTSKMMVKTTDTIFLDLYISDSDDEDDPDVITDTQEADRQERIEQALRSVDLSVNESYSNEQPLQAVDLSVSESNSNEDEFLHEILEVPNKSNHHQSKYLNISFSSTTCSSATVTTATNSSWSNASSSDSTTGGWGFSASTRRTSNDFLSNSKSSLHGSFHGSLNKSSAHGSFGAYFFNNQGSSSAGEFWGGGSSDDNMAMVDCSESSSMSYISATSSKMKQLPREVECNEHSDNDAWFDCMSSSQHHRRRQQDHRRRNGTQKRPKK